MRGSSRRITIIVLLIITVALIGLVVFVAARLSQSQAPKDTGATGFGPGATTNLFDDVDSAFANATCDDLYPETALSSVITGGAIGVTTQPADELAPKSCLIQFTEDTYAVFEVYTYNKDSNIDASSSALISRVNGLVQSADPALESGKSNGIDYFFNYSAETYEVCVTTMFHAQNDFEYAALYYYGFDCSTLAQTNKRLTDVSTNNINQIMIGVNKRFAEEQ